MNIYHTDLAMECGRVSAGSELPGVHVERSERGSVSRVRVDVLDEEGERETGKPRGAYTTLYSDSMEQGSDSWEALCAMLSEEIAAMAGLGSECGDDSVLVLGLGNRLVTPDSIGPRAADMVLSTRALREQAGMGMLRRVMTASPGVYGATGIDAGELLRGLVREVHPTLIIALDALCARDPARIATTVQLSDSGIQPGSGVGNHRAALNRQSLGVPVIAIGVPTVVHARAIVEGALSSMAISARPELIGAASGDMIVAPRDIDSLVSHASRLISAALNRALQPALSDAELRWLTI